MDKFITRSINALTWMIVGMLFMSRFYCHNLGITSGPMYIGWDTVAFVLGAVATLRLLMWVDPSFREQ